MAAADALTLLAHIREELQGVQSSLADHHLAARSAGDSERERLAHNVRSQLQGVLGEVEELGSELDELLERGR